MPEKPPDRAREPSAAVPHYHGHRGRLRPRFREAGTEALSAYELLELLLFRALARRDVKPLAKSLMQEFGSFAEIVAAPETRPREVKGLGDATTEMARATDEALPRQPTTRGDRHCHAKPQRADRHYARPTALVRIAAASVGALFAAQAT